MAMVMVYACPGVHDETSPHFGMKRSQLQLLDVDDDAGRKRQAPSTYEPIRVKLDTTYLYQEDASRSQSRICSSIGQLVNFTAGSFRSVVNCTQGQILTTDKALAILETVNLATSYLSALIKVLPETAYRVVSDPKCGTFGGLPIDPVYNNGSLEAVDLVLLVTGSFSQQLIHDNPLANSIPKLHAGWPGFTDTLAANAKACRFNKKNRAVMGHININPLHVIPDDGGALGRVVLHEIIHVLGFGAEHWAYFWDPVQQRVRNESEVIVEATVFGKKTWKLVTPNLLSAARSFFNCSSLDGVELEG